MHKVEIRAAIVERVLARRGRLHLFDSLDPRRAALLVIDMQNAFLAPGAPIEVPAARGIIAPINRLAAELRRRGVTIVWVAHENRADGRDWTGFFDAFVAPGRRTEAAAALAAGSKLQQLWPELDVQSGDLRVAKSRYSVLIKNDFEEELRERGIDTLLIAGTKTNVCVECTARDAMMLDFKVVLVSDCTAALSDEEHRATLENVIQQFGDVRTADEALALLDAGAGPRSQTAMG
ncbi:MAG TPA: isochorismatase family cysteine hydrolase [Burkholderiales bacterium]|jgi:ureidoacrylate peracid hydrolase|nr:isochorismatase family cysteine hydrolase [Burkholderiales bacterium]